MAANQGWHKGPPPHVGWWNASVNRDRTIWRWWNGTNWSAPAWQGNPRYAATRQAKSRATETTRIEWRDYYPENARVPRVAP